MWLRCIFLLEYSLCEMSIIRAGISPSRASPDVPPDVALDAVPGDGAVECRCLAVLGWVRLRRVDGAGYAAADSGDGAGRSHASSGMPSLSRAITRLS